MNCYTSTCWSLTEFLFFPVWCFFSHVTHIGPPNLGIDVSRHVSAAVLLLQLSVAGGQPLPQGGALLLELLRQRQSLLQVLLALRYLQRWKKKRRESVEWAACMGLKVWDVAVMHWRRMRSYLPVLPGHCRAVWGQWAVHPWLLGFPSAVSAQSAGLFLSPSPPPVSPR